MDKIRELMFYIKDRSEGPYVSKLLSKYGKKVVKQTAISLLAWLRGYGDGARRPLILNPKSQLDQLVYAVVIGDDLPEAFQCQGSVIEFRSTTSEEERNRIASFVADHHRPEEQLLEF
jgi:hypothetical protein